MAVAVAVIYQLQRFVFSLHISGRGQAGDWRLELVLCHTDINTFARWFLGPHQHSV